MADALGRSSLAIGLLVTGAGLHLKGLFRPSLAAGVAVFLKLVLMPVIAVALALRFGITGSNLADRDGLFGGADLVQRLCAGPPDGRRRAAARADHHAADHSGGGDDADRDCAGRRCKLNALRLFQIQEIPRMAQFAGSGKRAFLDEVLQVTRRRCT